MDIFEELLFWGVTRMPNNPQTTKPEIIQRLENAIIMEMVSRESVIVRLTLLIGACRTKSITKKQIEQSLESYIKELSHAKR